MFYGIDLEALTVSLVNFNHEKTRPNGRDLSWWSCGESHPGPCGSKLLFYKHSLS